MEQRKGSLMVSQKIAGVEKPECKGRELESESPRNSIRLLTLKKTMRPERKWSSAEHHPFWLSRCLFPFNPTVNCEHDRKPHKETLLCYQALDHSQLGDSLSKVLPAWSQALFIRSLWPLGVTKTTKALCSVKFSVTATGHQQHAMFPFSSQVSICLLSATCPENVSIKPYPWVSGALVQRTVPLSTSLSPWQHPSEAILGQKKNKCKEVSIQS